jgi:hypothetical protein
VRAALPPPWCAVGATEARSSYLPIAERLNIKNPPAPFIPFIELVVPGFGDSS